jgi:PAS domain S-box-containing protein
MREIFSKNRLLLGIMLPVMVIGTIFSIAVIYFLLPPVISHLRAQSDAMLRHASNMGISICEDRLNNILELRLEDNLEMDTASRKEAIEQIRNISRILPGIQAMVIDRDGNIITKSYDLSVDRIALQDHHARQPQILSKKLGEKPVRLHYRYFPFWDWYVVSMIFEDDYMKPILMARRIVLLGTFGVLLVVLATLLALFLWRIDRPLRTIIRGTEDVANGHLNPLNVKGKDEIARVSMAFNSMVGSLVKDKEKINDAVRKLRRSEEQYKVLTESSLTNIAMIRNHAFVFANRRMLASLDYDSDDFIGMTFWNIIHPTDMNRVKNRIQALGKDASGMDHFECRVVSKHGQTLWFELIAARILYREKNNILIHAIDTTIKKKDELARRRLEEKLSRARKMEAIGALAGGVAHDLNNILSGIVGYPDLMLLDMAEDDRLRKPIEEIRKSGQKAADIVQDMLTLARRGVAITNIVNMNDIITEYLNSPEYASLKSFHPDVVMETRLASDLLNMKGSGIHLSKTIMNLVSNAAESMPEGGNIRISTRNQYIDTAIGNYDTVTEGDYVCVSISDTGIGIPPEDLEKIFEPFYTKKKMGRSGTGLGMALVWGAVKDHNGYIDMHSTPGKGTVFTLYFPVTREALESAATPFSIEQCMGKGQAVLVVDDVKEQRDIASGMLKKMGYQVSVASSGEEAVAYMTSQSADILLLDMIMEPGIDGLETYQQILAVSPGQKAVIASGFSETDRVKAAQRLGAGKYIKKPYTIESLGLAVQQELKR